MQWNSATNSTLDIPDLFLIYSRFTAKDFCISRLTEYTSITIHGTDFYQITIRTAQKVCGRHADYLRYKSSANLWLLQIIIFNLIAKFISSCFDLRNIQLSNQTSATWPLYYDNFVVGVPSYPLACFYHLSFRGHIFNTTFMLLLGFFVWFWRVLREDAFLHKKMWPSSASPRMLSQCPRTTTKRTKSR